VRKHLMNTTVKESKTRKGLTQECQAPDGRNVIAIDSDTSSQRHFESIAKNCHWLRNRKLGSKMAVEKVKPQARPTVGLLAAGWRGAEGVTGHFPLEWVVPHEVGARERPFPPKAVVQKRRTPSG